MRTYGCNDYGRIHAALPPENEALLPLECLGIEAGWTAACERACGGIPHQTRDEAPEVILAWDLAYIRLGALLPSLEKYLLSDNSLTLYPLHPFHNSDQDYYMETR